jgi:hypothetical protein
MDSDIHELAVQIMRFVDDSFPGWVACEFLDAEGRRHELVDKYPIVSNEVLEPDSKYPQPGSAQCKVLSRSQDSGGRDLARIRLLVAESTEGLSEFVVLSTQLSAGVR